MSNSVLAVALPALMQTTSLSKLTFQAVQINVLLIEGFCVSFAAVSTLHAVLWLSGVLVTLMLSVGLLLDHD